MRPTRSPITAAIAYSFTTPRPNRRLAMFCSSRSYRGIGMTSEPHELTRENALPSTTREDRACERRDQENPKAKDSDDDQRLQPVHEVVILSDSRWNGRQVLEDEPLEDHQKRERDDWHKGVLHEGLKPGPEQPIEFRDDEERDENRTEERANRARDQAERHNGQRQHFGDRDDNQQQPIEQVGQD